MVRNRDVELEVKVRVRACSRAVGKLASNDNYCIKPYQASVLLQVPLLRPLHTSLLDRSSFCSLQSPSIERLLVGVMYVVIQ